MSALRERLSRWARPTGFKLALGLSIVVAAVYLIVSAAERTELSFFSQVEAKALDAKLRLRGRLPLAGYVTVVGIDEQSIAEYGRWPWNRDRLATLVDRLGEAGARVVAFDVLFSDADRAGRHVALQEAYDRYRGALGGPIAPSDGSATANGTAPPTGRLTPAAARPDTPVGRLPDLETWLEREISSGNPDLRFSESIFRSGRVVLGLFAHSDDGRGRILSDAHFESAFQRVRPFFYDHLTEADGDGLGKPDPVAIDGPNLKLPVVTLGLETPLPQIAGATPFFGYVNISPDPDGVLRRLDLVTLHRDALVPSLALRTVAAYLNSDLYAFRDASLPRRLGWIRLQLNSALSQGLGITDAHGALEWTERRNDAVTSGPWEAAHLSHWRATLAERNRAYEAALDASEDADPPPIDPITVPGFTEEQVVEIPLDAFQYGKYLVNHVGGEGDFDVVSALDVIEGRADRDLLNNRIALVGVTALGTYDQRVTPFDEFFPGVFVHASIIDNILSQRFITRQSWLVPLEILILLFIGLAVGLFMPRLNRGPAIGAFIFLGLLLYGAADYGIFASTGYDLFTVTPMLTFLGLTLSVAVFQWVVVDKEKRQVRRAFQHYLAPSVLETMLGDPSKLALEPTKAELTVLFSDIRGFTTISERLTPEQLAVVLNEYLTPMTHIVFKHGGTLDKYMGDAVMAFWGDPVPQEDHPLRACATALEMQAKCLELAAAFEERGWPPLEIGIGINTGFMSVGNFGSDVLFDYTVMGDAVNLGSRLEGTNKQYGTRIIVSEFTYDRVKDEIVVRELDAVRVKGKREPVRIFELLALGRPTADDEVFLAAFAEGLAHYKAQRWDEAVASFRRCGELRPGDYPSQMYIGRSNAMKAEPPGADWDGTYTMQTK